MIRKYSVYRNDTVKRSTRRGLQRRRNVLVFFELAYFVLSIVALVFGIIEAGHSNVVWAIAWFAAMFALTAKSEICNMKLARLNGGS